MSEFFTKADIDLKIDGQVFHITARRLKKQEEKSLKKEYGLYETVKKVEKGMSEIRRLEDANAIDRELADAIGGDERVKILKRIQKRMAKIETIAGEIEGDKYRYEEVEDEVESINRKRFDLMVSGDDKDKVAEYGENYGYGPLIDAITVAFSEALKKK